MIRLPEKVAECLAVALHTPPSDEGLKTLERFKGEAPALTRSLTVEAYGTASPDVLRQ